MKFLILLSFLFHSFLLSQTLSSLDKGLVIGNLLIQGYTAIKGTRAKAVDPNAKNVESFCFKNKLNDKIAIKLTGRIEDEEVKKEFVIQKDDKECTYDLPKGIYSYEVLLPNKEVFQQGEYKIIEEALMTINQ